MTEEQKDSHHVKGRRIGSKQFAFLTQTGLNRLKVYAVFYSKTGADEVAVEMAKLNPGYEFKAVPAWPKKRNV